MTSRLPLLLLCLVVLFASACSRQSKDYDRPLPPGAIALEEVPYAEWPDFNLRDMDRRNFIAGIDYSLKYLGAKSASRKFPVAGVTQEQVIKGLQRFRELILSGMTDSQIRDVLRREFRVLRSVGWDGSGEVLFTGYYTPIFEARLEPDSRFRYPVYKRPDDLIPGPTHITIAKQQLAGGATRPYPSAGQIRQSGMLKGLELVWFEDPFDAYIVVVQGSAKIRLAGGREYEIGYAGTNGHQYRPIAKDLVNEGHIASGELNLASMRKFFRENPHQVANYINRNPRMVFFQEAPGGPFGSLGQPVTTDVSIATDKAIFPPGALTFVTTQSRNRYGQVQNYQAFRLDQDTGGAIQAPGRCDLYMGVGAEAEVRAGHQLYEGLLYYLVAR